jgi:biopolymer transport protein ExbB
MNVRAIVLAAAALALCATPVAAQSSNGQTGSSESGAQQGANGNQGQGSAEQGTSAEEAAVDIQSEALVRAYQREFVFLDNEIRNLQQRLEEVEERGKERVGAARDELEQLEARLLELNSEVERKNRQLDTLQSQETNQSNADNALQSIVEQGNTRLQENDVPTFSQATDRNMEEMPRQDRLIAEVQHIFDRSFELLNRFGSIRQEEGSFFLQNGEEVDGTLVHVGQVASFGVSEGVGGTLAPAGGGALRLVRPEQETTARRLARGEQPAVLPIFLYESLDELVETGGETSFRQTVEDSGVIGLIIIAIGIASVLLIVTRSIILARMGRSNKPRLEETFEQIQGGSLEDALQEARRLPGAMGRVMVSTIRGLQTDPKNIEDIISESVLNEQPALDRFRSALSVFAAVAPLLGLLGTVTGMITTFDVITQYGTGDPQLLSGGISEALITTEFGLAVAIPTLLIGNLLSSWSDRITSNIEVSALRAANISGGYEGAQRA